MAKKPDQSPISRWPGILAADYAYKRLEFTSGDVREIFFIGGLRVGFETASPTRSATLSGYAQFYSRSHHAVIRVYDAAGDVIGTHEHAGEFTEW